VAACENPLNRKKSRLEGLDTAGTELEAGFPHLCMDGEIDALLRIRQGAAMQKEA